MISVIICAAGKGTRTGLSQNKILQELNGLPVLCHSLCAFAPFADEILIPCRKEDEGAIAALLSPYPQARTVAGGQTRFESVSLALQKACGELVLVHDGARPFVSEQIIADCIGSVRTFGSGICSLPATDTTVLARNGAVRSVPAREEVFTVQTPQGFRTEELRAAFACAEADGKTFTDESGVYAAYVRPPHLFLGERTNRKLTYAEDFMPAARVGFGTDTHAFGAPSDHIVLAGVQIPAKSGLVAHSDGDVLVHAVMDALLSAAGLRDIGYYFPDTDGRFRGADSMQLLAQTLRLVQGRGLSPRNVSVSVLAEHPRLAPYIGEMKRSLASALSLPDDAVGIAAGTNEKLGYVGEGRGITVYATVLLKE